MSDWYPGSNRWEQTGAYKVKHKFDRNGKCTDILMARYDLSDKEADRDHIHIYKIGESDQGAVFRDDQGKILNLTDFDIQLILSGARPLF